jgi:uncharacterized membrane protein YkvA (DUF1232 family)
MLNLSPIGHEQALKFAAEEGDGLIRGRPVGGIEKLLQAVERIRHERPDELAAVRDELDGLIGIVRRAVNTDSVPGKALRVAVAALAYLRNPYDRIFDLHVEGGFTDDMEVLRDAWASLGLSRG